MYVDNLTFHSIWVFEKIEKKKHTHTTPLTPTFFPKKMFEKKTSRHGGQGERKEEGKGRGEGEGGKKWYCIILSDPTQFTKTWQAEGRGGRRGRGRREGGGKGDEERGEGMLDCLSF